MKGAAQRYEELGDAKAAAAINERLRRRCSTRDEAPAPAEPAEPTEPAEPSCELRGTPSPRA